MCLRSTKLIFSFFFFKWFSFITILQSSLIFGHNVVFIHTHTVKSSHLKLDLPKVISRFFKISIPNKFLIFIKITFDIEQTMFDLILTTCQTIFVDNVSAIVIQNCNDQGSNRI